MASSISPGFDPFPEGRSQATGQSPEPVFHERVEGVWMACALHFQGASPEGRETRTKEHIMDDRTLHDRGTENSIKGKLSNAAGRVKDAIGGLTGDSGMQAEGKVDQVKGKVQDKFGEVQRDLDKPRDRGL
jgi:uncharacterized protein YjbJ (UPF0337 family)